ncbi:hypothetical protein [Rathayibacter oskolensis]|uniref:hypothetical protein n=1 Tax=Rathayibacter oskolensis TaxID=1891671 RepID=UPI0034662ED2
MGYEREAAALLVPPGDPRRLRQRSLPALQEPPSDPEVLPNQIQVGGLETLVATVVAFVVDFTWSSRSSSSTSRAAASCRS